MTGSNATFASQRQQVVPLTRTDDDRGTGLPRGSSKHPVPSLQQSTFPLDHNNCTHCTANRKPPIELRWSNRRIRVSYFGAAFLNTRVLSSLSPCRVQHVWTNSCCHSGDTHARMHTPGNDRVEWSTTVGAAAGMLAVKKVVPVAAAADGLVGWCHQIE